MAREHEGQVWTGTAWEDIEKVFPSQGRQPVREERVGENSRKTLLERIRETPEGQARELRKRYMELHEIMFGNRYTDAEKELASQEAKAIFNAAFGDKEVSGSTEIPEIGGGWDRPSQEGSRGLGDGPRGLGVMTQGRKHYRKDDSSGNNPGGAR